MKLAILLMSLMSIPLTGSILRRLSGSRSQSSYLRLFLESGIGYAMFLGLFALYEWRLESALNVFDINQDGIFSGNEISAAQGAAMDAYINDAGRNMLKLIAPALFLAVGAIRCAVVAWRKGHPKRKQ